jgi:hypothetical protein
MELSRDSGADRHDSTIAIQVNRTPRKVCACNLLYFTLQVPNTPESGDQKVFI